MGHPVRMCGMRRPSHAILGWIGIALVSASCFPVQPRLHVQPRPVPSRLFEVSRPSAVTGPQTRPSPLTTMPTVSEGVAPHRAVLDRYCVSCHNERLRTAGLALDTANIEQVAEGAEVWEKVATKLRTGGMPPLGRPRPDAQTYDRFASWLETQLDRGYATRPDPGRTETFHRLNRAEYRNTIRDLLALDVEVSALLPGDDIDEHGFDNMADVLTLSPALMERYVSAARKIGRLAVGRSPACSFTIGSGWAAERRPPAGSRFDETDAAPTDPRPHSQGRRHGRSRQPRQTCRRRDRGTREPVARPPRVRPAAPAGGKAHRAVRGARSDRTWARATWPPVQRHGNGSAVLQAHSQRVVCHLHVARER